MKKKITMVVSLLLVMALSIGGTLAYLTDETDAIENTFTIGNVTIELKENTGKEYKTVADYEPVLIKVIKGDLAYKKISEGITIIKYPKSELSKTYKAYIDNKIYEQFGDISSYSQKAFDKLVSDAEASGKFSYSALYAEALAEAKVSVKERLVLEYLFDEFDIKVSNKTYKEKLKNDFETYYYYYVSYYQITSVEMLESYYGKDYFMLQYKLEALVEYLGENCESVITYEK